MIYLLRGLWLGGLAFKGSCPGNFISKCIGLKSSHRIPSLSWAKIPSNPFKLHSKIDKMLLSPLQYLKKAKEMYISGL